MKINLLTVCTDTYPIEYARKLITKVQQVSNLEFVPYCITDRPKMFETAGFATPITNAPGVTSWWNKVLLFNPNMPDGWNLYMDLDIVVQQNFDEEIMWAIDNGFDDYITCVSDAISWMGNHFSSSWMMFKTGKQTYIYDAFMKNIPEIQKDVGGDQVWIGKQMYPKTRYIDQVYPNLKKNLKFHLGKKNIVGDWCFPEHLDRNIKLVDCGGRPKPHDLDYLYYIKENWHNV